MMSLTISRIEVSSPPGVSRRMIASGASSSAASSSADVDPLLGRRVDRRRELDRGHRARVLRGAAAGQQHQQPGEHRATRRRSRMRTRASRRIIRLIDSAAYFSMSAFEVASDVYGPCLQVDELAARRRRRRSPGRPREPELVADLAVGVADARVGQRQLARGTSSAASVGVVGVDAEEGDLVAALGGDAPGRRGTRAGRGRTTTPTR